MQLIAVVILIVLFIKFSMTNVNTIMNNDHFMSQHVAKNVVMMEDISPSQNTKVNTEQFSGSTRGYIISSSFWEQQVGAALNLWTLAK